MNKGHRALCSSARWARFIQGEVIPAAMAGSGVVAPALEIGPGYGAATQLLLERTDRLEAVEIDAALARRLAAKYPAVSVTEQSAEELPFADGSFGSAFSFTMLHHVHTSAAQDAIFAETRRVLRPGGVFAGSDSIASAGLRAFHHHDTYQPVDPDTLPDRLRSAGFDGVVVEAHGDWFSFRATA